MGPLGWPETVFIVILALLLFGPKKLPELGRTLGKAITEFRKASAELRSTFDREMRNLERETEAVKENTNAHFQDSYNYDYSSYDTGTPYPTETPVQPSEASAAVDDSGYHHPHEGASADQGAPLTAAAETNSGITVSPAAGIIANGSLSGESGHHAGNQEAAQDSLKS